MTTLNINLNEIPDSFTIEPGVYKAQLVSVPTQEQSKSSPGTNLVCESVILEGKYANRKLKDYIPLSFPMKLKQLCKAVGVTDEGGQLNLEELTGKDYQIVVKTEPYTKDDVTRETSKIDEYLSA